MISKGIKITALICIHPYSLSRGSFGKPGLGSPSLVTPVTCTPPVVLEAAQDRDRALLLWQRDGSLGLNCFLFGYKNLIKYRTFLLETRVNPKLRYAFGIVRFELICLHQPQLHKAFPIHPQGPCGSPARTQRPGQHSRGQTTMELTLQLGHFQPAQVHILT